MTSQLKGLLTDIAEGARVYDVIGTAEQRGRRRRHMRQAITAAGTAAAVAILGIAMVSGLGGLQGMAPQPGATLSDTPGPTLPGSPTPEQTTPTPQPPVVTSCEIERLAIPPGYPVNIEISGGDPTGRFILGNTYWQEGRPEVLVWDNGVVTTVDMPGETPLLVDVNSRGLAVGHSDANGYIDAAYFWFEGELIRLGGEKATAFAVNESGVAVGQVDDRPVVWRWPSTEPEPLPVLAEFPLGAAHRILEDGTVLGFLSPADGMAYRDVRWLPDGTIVDSAVSWTAGVTNAHGWTGSFNDKDGYIQGSGIGRVALPRLPGYDYESYDVALSPVGLISDDGRTIAGYIVLGSYEQGGNDRIPVVWHCT